MNVEDLSMIDRTRLVQLACIAAWSDADLAAEERAFILDLCRRLDVPDDVVAQVREWIARGPPNLDPNDIPRRHGATFLAVVADVAAADGRIDPEESETIRLLRELLA